MGSDIVTNECASPSRSRRFHSCSDNDALHLASFRNSLRLPGFFTSAILIARLRKQAREELSVGKLHHERKHKPKKSQVYVSGQDLGISVLDKMEFDIAL